MNPCIPEGQTELNVGLGGNLDGRGEDVDLVPEQPPAGEVVAVVGEVPLVQRGHVDGEDVLAALRRHHVALEDHIQRIYSAGKVSGYIQGCSVSRIQDTCSVEPRSGFVSGLESHFQVHFYTDTLAKDTLHGSLDAEPESWLWFADTDFQYLAQPWLNFSNFFSLDSTRQNVSYRSFFPL